MRRLLPKLCAVAVLVLTAGLGAPALAHVGDHSHMTFAELADHLLSRLDHTLTIATVMLLLGAAGFAALLMRRNARVRAPERR